MGTFIRRVGLWWERIIKIEWVFRVSNYFHSFGEI